MQISQNDEVLGEIVIDHSQSPDISWEDIKVEEMSDQNEEEVDKETMKSVIIYLHNYFLFCLRVNASCMLLHMQSCIVLIIV